MQGVGIGSKIIDGVVSRGKAAKILRIKIEVSHLSTPLFAKHGAAHIREVENGWGSGMHRIEMELKL